MYLTVLSCTIKNGGDGKFYVMCILQLKKIFYSDTIDI